MTHSVYYKPVGGGQYSLDCLEDRFNSPSRGGDRL